MRKKGKKEILANKNTEKSIELECIPSLHIMQSRCYWNNAPAVKTRHETWKCMQHVLSPRQQAKAESTRIDCEELKGLQMILPTTNKIMLLFYVFESQIAQTSPGVSLFRRFVLFSRSPKRLRTATEKNSK